MYLVTPKNNLAIIGAQKGGVCARNQDSVSEKAGFAHGTNIFNLVVRRKRFNAHRS
jgi:hypothetical protein